jgi:hypothetical protein
LARRAITSDPRGMSENSNAARDITSDSSDSSYGGPERRRHRVYVTKNTEYHFRDGFCVAVRDRRTGDFLHGHLALRRRVHGGLKFFLNGAIQPNPGEPNVGEALYFATDGRDLVTSPLESIERPSKDVVRAYSASKKK